MKHFMKYLLILAVIAVIAVLSSSCLRQDLIMYEDGDFDGIEFSDYDLMNNAEIEMDDLDRNWFI